MILTAGCFFVYFLTFEKFGVTAKMIFMNNNNFFPLANTPTDDAIPYYYSTDGRRYTADDQNHILFVVQGT